MSSVDKEKIAAQVRTVAEEVIAAGNVEAEDIFVLGCSTSEVCGVHIGKGSDPAVGEVIVATLLEVTKAHNMYLVVQGCEHINRALAIEKTAAKKYGFEIVSVVPALHAGGACSVAAFKQFEHPVEVEHIVAKVGIDIGDTAIGMHVKHVQVPFRPSINAHVTALISRPKLIGGERAIYQ